MSVHQKFWPYVADRIAIEDRGYKSPCWVWQPWKTEKGYGRAKVPGYDRLTRVHRATYEATKGEIPDGHHVDHLCRVKACCNPAHLEAVTPEENYRRAVEAGLMPSAEARTKTHCIRGHEFTPENRYADGTCKKCHVIHQRRYEDKNREKVRETRRRWRLANPEKVAAMKRRYKERLLHRDGG